jgi:predicted peptidase
MTKIFLFPLMVLCFQFSVAQDLSLFEKKVFKSKSGQELNYRILYPENYKKSEKYPVMLFLHGAGERGNDNEKQLIHGATLFLDPANREKYPAIVLFPQCPEGKSWASLDIRTGEGGRKIYNRPNGTKPGEMALLLNGLLKDILKDNKVDAKRVYIMGLSMGGFGTLEMLYLYPKTFAAAVPICGGHLTDLASVYAKSVPVWLFHGAKDTVVPPEFSRDLYAKLKELGAEVKYTEFPDANHDSWTGTFATPELLPWIFSHKRK